MRKHYGLLPNDPTFLDLDDDEIEDEAVRIKFQQLHERRCSDPVFKAATEPNAEKNLLDGIERMKKDPTWQLEMLRRAGLLPHATPSIAPPARPAPSGAPRGAKGPTLRASSRPGSTGGRGRMPESIKGKS